MHNFVVKLSQLEAAIPRYQLQTVVDVKTLVDRFTDKAVADEVPAIGQSKF
jgi:hypothetical protein